MTSIWTEHHPLFATSTKKLLHRQEMNINLPPRKLLTRRSNLIPIPISTFDHDFLAHELIPSPDTQTIKIPLKFLPYNNTDEHSDEDESLYSTDDFRIYEFKVRRCMRSRSHDWTDCPFAHPGEKARRRDPSRFHYSGDTCSDFRRGNCSRGDSCEFAHGVFECWLHPARYRTQVCKDGKNCKRKVCFFAHSPKQLRVLPLSSDQSLTDQFSLSKNSSSLSKNITHHCNCVFCLSSLFSSSSPTSTLMGFSHSSSSPPSPRILSSSEISTTNTKKQQSLLGMLSYKNKLRDLVSSLEAMDLTAISSPHNSVNDQDFSWGGGSVSNSPSIYYEYPQQFILSPDSTLQSTTGMKDFFSDQEDYGLSSSNNDNGGISSSCTPDLDWVNELVM